MVRKWSTVPISLSKNTPLYSKSPEGKTGSGEISPPPALHPLSLPLSFSHGHALPLPSRPTSLLLSSGNISPGGARVGADHLAQALAAEERQRDEVAHQQDSLRLPPQSHVRAAKGERHVTPYFDFRNTELIEISIR
jgi:hypothetical protein